MKQKVKKRKIFKKKTNKYKIKDKKKINKMLFTHKRKL